MAETRFEELPEVNKVFVDREDQQKLFRELASSIPANGVSLLVFHGIGGQGKTWLAKRLASNCDGAKDPEFRHHRPAVVDLAKQTSLTDPDMLLVLIRNAFAAKGIDFPCFDLALALAWEAGRPEMLLPHLVSPWLQRTKELAPDAIGEAADSAKEWLSGEGATELLGEMVTQLPFVGPLIRRGGAWAFKRGKEKYLHQTRDHLKLLYKDGQLRPDDELSRLLPVMLAKDLAHHRRGSAYAQFVLFVDEYERVFDQGGASDRYEDNKFDQQMRRFLSEADATMAVFFTRERLPWEQLAAWKAQLDGRQVMLDGLPQADARMHLDQVPITDAAIRDAMIAASRESNADDMPVYPLLLDMAVEHWSQIVAAGEAPKAGDFRIDATGFNERCRFVTNRLLRSYSEPLQETIRRLAFTRRFDRTLFRAIVADFQTGLPAAAFDRLKGLSFMRSGGPDHLFLHQAVAEIIREIQPPAYAQETHEFLFAHFDRLAAVADHRAVTDTSVDALFEAAWHRRQAGMIEGWVEWLFERAEPVRMAARYPAATLLWEDAVSILGGEFGAKHPWVSTALVNLGDVLRGRGMFSEAEPAYREAIAIREAAYGKSHPNVVTPRNNLAEMLLSWGKFEEAEGLLRQTLDEMKTSPDADRTVVAILEVNFATLLHQRGRLDEAETLYRSAIDVMEAAAAHQTDAASVLNNLALLLLARGKPAEGETACRRALAILERTVGTRHPDFATAQNTLAELQRAQGKDVEPLHRQVLAARAASLGAEHPDLVATLNNLAESLVEAGAFSEAEKHYRDALAAGERLLAHDHPDVAVVRSNLAMLLVRQGQTGEAATLLRSAIETFEQKLGPDHPYVATGLGNLALLLLAQGKPAESETAGRRALSIVERNPGTGQPDIATIRETLAAALAAQGKTAEATAPAGAPSEEASDSSDPLAMFVGPAQALARAGRHAEAEQYFRYSVEVGEAMLGKDHPDIAVVLSNLAHMLGQQSRFAEAEPLHRRAVRNLVNAQRGGHPYLDSAMNHYLAMLQARDGKLPSSKEFADLVAEDDLVATNDPS